MFGPNPLPSPHLPVPNASNTFPPPSPQTPNTSPGHSLPPGSSTTPLEQVARQLGLAPRALVRLCVKFRLPAHAYGGHSAGGTLPALPYPLYDTADNHFTDADIQVLHHVHTRILAGDTLNAIARDWQQQQQLAKQASPPAGSTFTQVLHTAAAPMATPPAPPPTTATTPVFQQLAGQLNAPVETTHPTAPTNNATLPQPAAATGAINALFSPTYSPAIGLTKLPDIDPQAIFREQRRWPTQHTTNPTHQQPKHQQAPSPSSLSGAFLAAVKQPPPRH